MRAANKVTARTKSTADCCRLNGRNIFFAVKHVGRFLRVSGHCRCKKAAKQFSGKFAAECEFTVTELGNCARKNWDPYRFDKIMTKCKCRSSKELGAIADWANAKTCGDKMRAEAMKIFHCDNCDHLVFFENVQCVKCQRALAYIPEIGAIQSLAPAGGNLWNVSQPGGETPPIGCVPILSGEHLQLGGAR